MTYTVKEKLQQLIDIPDGGVMPPFFSEDHSTDPFMNWAEPLRKMAREALDEIGRLEKGMFNHLMSL